MRGNARREGWLWWLRNLGRTFRALRMAWRGVPVAPMAFGPAGWRVQATNAAGYSPAVYCLPHVAERVLQVGDPAMGTRRRALAFRVFNAEGFEVANLSTRSGHAAARFDANGQRMPGAAALQSLTAPCPRCAAADDERGGPRLQLVRDEGEGGDATS